MLSSRVMIRNMFVNRLWIFKKEKYRKNMKYLIFIILLFTLQSCLGSVSPSHYKDTPVYDLAVAIDSEEIVDIHNILSKDSTLMYFNTAKLPSMFIIVLHNKRFESIKTLLDMGYSPDTRLESGESWFASACAMNNINYMKLFLKYNPNLDFKYQHINNSTINYTPLIAAIYSKNIDNFYLLVEKGADCNLSLPDGWTALASSLGSRGNIKIAHYLMIEKKVDFKLPIGKYADNSDRYIVDRFRWLTFPLGSEEHKLKMECVEYMKKHGVDYFKTPIPDHIQRKYKDDPEYLEKY